MRCPACSAFTRFEGIAHTPAFWVRYEICDRCEALYWVSADGRLLGGRRAIDPEGRPFHPPLGLREGRRAS